MAQIELIYKYEVIVMTDDGKVIHREILDHFTFPTDEELMGIISEQGGTYCKVDRIYVPDEVPFSE